MNPEIETNLNPRLHDLKVVALAGGVGGARLTVGLARALPPQNLTVIVNTGDDLEHYGLSISPDLDTVCYTLAGLANPETGWGRLDESYAAMGSAIALGGPDWFRLGDRDLGTHLERTRRLRLGQSLSQITRDFCAAWGIHSTVLPASDAPTPTMVLTEQGELTFQEYFVRQRCQPAVLGFRFAGVEQAEPAAGVLEAIGQADLVVICPSNPWVSVDPILALPGLRSRLLERRSAGAPVAAVSPIIGGQTVKGPAAKMYAELGVRPSALAVARHYQGLLSAFIFDRQDSDLQMQIEALGLRALATDSLMRDAGDRMRLAIEVIEFAL